MAWRRARPAEGWRVLDPKGKPLAWDREREEVKAIVAQKMSRGWGTLVGEGFKLRPGSRPAELPQDEAS